MSYIYVAESGDGYIKIGKTNSPAERKATIQSGMGISITKFRAFECEGDSLVSEKEAHRLLSSLSLFGEWFACKFDDAVNICRYVSKNPDLISDTDEVKINLGVPESLSKDLKEIAKGKGMKFHAFLNQELTKVANRGKKG